ncbi:MAG: class I SAM-dependent methyltransferase, partial [Chloroflexi bacterium]|nr:class I SAM-dependent methyltransferase [Chloroflexota bacterium]
AGCGSGAVTGQLLERLPRGRVIAADLSPAMLAQARATLAQHAERVTFVEVNLLEIDTVLRASQPVDAVVSTATFHWIDDHARLFAGLHGVMRPGAQLVSQFGGGANLAGFMRATDTLARQEPYRAHLAGKPLWRFYYSAEQTRERLQHAGFVDVDTWLEDSPQTFTSAEALADYARAIVLRAHLAALPAALHARFLHECVEQIRRENGGLTLDYVRLNADARA